jgi:hypothetical protein
MQTIGLQKREQSARFLLYAGERALQEGNALVAQMHALRLQCAAEAEIACDPKRRPLNQQVLLDAQKVHLAAVGSAEAKAHR